ncbi:chlorohydrolase [Planctomycetia bacterium]|nr:chlorohydrolase [Planctomycetia bacterium]
MISRRLKAKWILPVDRPPIENGLIEIVDGVITAVRAADSHDAAADDLGDVAIIPGLVNAHIHLEFSLVNQPFQPALPFTDWIRSLVAYRRQFTPDSTEPGVALNIGAIQAVMSGTTLLGDIATSNWSEIHLPIHAPRFVAFRELIGLRPEAVGLQIELAEEWLKREEVLLSLPEGHLTYGLSPHAPYSVSPELLRRSIELAKRFDAPVAMHLAETRDELEFLADGRGAFVEMLKSFGAWPDGGLPTGRRPLDILRVLANAPRALVVHGNYLADDEIEFIAARPQMSVVYCPRTHEFFGHEPHPWRRLLAKGANVALGTDGRGSNPDLSLWNELIFLRERFPDVSPSQLLELGTLAGARALGCEHDCGTLAPGKRADLVAVALGGRGDPLEALLTTGSQIVRTVCGGELG